jgi:hypothetical protein
MVEFAQTFEDVPAALEIQDADSNHEGWNLEDVENELPKVFLINQQFWGAITHLSTFRLAIECHKYDNEAYNTDDELKHHMLPDPFVFVMVLALHFDQ